MVRRTKPTPQAASNNSGGVALAVIVGLVLLVGAASQCSSSGEDSNSLTMADMNAVDTNISTAVGAQTPAPVEPLNGESISRGASHLRLATGAEGFAGAMVYSQNCYDALTRQFSWTRLDTCGAFDLLTVRSATDSDLAGFDNEAVWFESEAAAGRYLAAATGAGQPAAEADERLAQLQARIAQLRPVARRAPPAIDDSTASNIGEAVNDALDEPMDEPMEEVAAE
ncbi:MAG TPA: hypothetical protein VN240_09790 [Propylenella sp.]|nr:hypothetical protein [Propylenella sp.]